MQYDSLGIPAAALKVAHAIHSGGFYGAEKVICDLAREQLACNDFEPRLLAIMDSGQTENEIANRAAGLGLPVTRIHSPAGISMQGLTAYAQALIESDIALVHSHGYKATAFHLFSRWLGMHRVPLIVTAHGYSKNKGDWKASLYRWFDIVCLGAAEGVVAVSQEMEDYLKVRNPACRLRTIPNGISSDIKLEDSHPLFAALGIPFRTLSQPVGYVPVIGTAGRLVPMKNQAMLIRAYAQVRKTAPCRLVIIGEGPLRSSLEQLWRELIPDEPIGLYPFQAKVLDWVADMDIFALPSNDGEGLPMALLEAGLLERAVVCTNSGGIPEVVHDWITGRLIEMGDLESLVRALVDLVMSPENRLAYGKALRREVLADHDIRATHGRYMEAYAQVLADA